MVDSGKEAIAADARVLIDTYAGARTLDLGLGLGSGLASGSGLGSGLTRGSHRISMHTLALTLALSLILTRCAHPRYHWRAASIPRSGV